ncbi:MAG: hypothetical protein SP4CHLAM5_10980 [Chlamydiia bacterium]|nr:hypothetical protein [Chlamydiia bacterium]MCH9618955.1 hypothetical protein [Chlamydiia bacterium]MCH9623950.1 hypothetical protein [Chlamydiia bacterium]
MTKLAISEGIYKDLLDFVKKNRNIDLITTYLSFLEMKHKLSPTVFMKEKKIFLSEDHLVKTLEKENKLSRETTIKIQLGKKSVNSETKKIYICPFSGKVFADNTHPNPQDAIYDWVSRCPENTERKDGIRVKKFYISEDPEIIKNYISPQTKELSKTVFSSVVTGKLFNNRKGVVQDLLESHIKHIPMKQVTTQNRFELHDDFLEFLESNLEDAKVSNFVETLSERDEFDKYIAKWVADAEEEEEAPESDEQE